KIKIHNIDEIDNMIILDLRYLFSKINERIVHYDGMKFFLSARDIVDAFNEFAGRFTNDNSIIKFVILYSITDDYSIDGDNILSNLIDLLNNVTLVEITNDNY